LNIAINACHYNDQEPSGARNRFAGLYSTVIRKATDTQFFVLEPKDSKPNELIIPQKNVQFIKTGLLSNSVIQRHLLGKLTINQILQKNQVHIFDTSYLPLLKYNKGKTLLTIHDLRYVHFPEWYSLPRRWFSQRITTNALKEADAIITVSQTMKNEILKFSAKARVEVVGNALSPEFLNCNTSVEKVQKIKMKYNLPQEYLLTVGHIEKRKNYLNLLKAMLILKKRNINIPLVAVGKRSDDTTQVNNFIKNNKLMNDVRFFYGLTESELACFYKGANLFVFPSIYEGFGMPLLEAMHSTIPFICSDIPVFREIVTGDSNFFNPYKPEEIAKSIEKNIKRNLLTGFNDVLEKYSWEKWAEKYISIMKVL